MPQATPSTVVALPAGVQARLDKAIQAFERGDESAALLAEFRALIDAGSKEANYYAGMMHEDGTNGAEKNLQHAYFYYQKSAEGYGFVQGSLALARMLYHGIGVTQDYRAAFERYSHIAENSESHVAYFMLGRMCQHGQGTSKNLLAARQWYQRAIAKGSVYGMLNLAMLEAEEGHRVKSIFLRLKAGWNAFRLSRRDPRSPLLRGG